MFLCHTIPITPFRFLPTELSKAAVRDLEGAPLRVARCPLCSAETALDEPSQQGLQSPLFQQLHIPLFVGLREARTHLHASDDGRWSFKRVLEIDDRPKRFYRTLHKALSNP